MSKIYRLSDRIKLKIDDLIVTISPLSIHQKASVEEVASKGGTSNLIRSSILSMKYSIKDVDGLEDSDGSKYELQFDEEGYLTESCLDDLFNTTHSVKLISVCLNLLNSVPEQFYDAMTGKLLEGVEFIKEKKDTPEKKSKVVSGK